MQRKSKKLLVLKWNLSMQIYDIDYDDAKTYNHNYTLQFIRPLQREKLVKKIYDSLEEKGIFIFSEKVISSIQH